MKARLSGLESRCLGDSETAACCSGCLLSARSRLWDLLYAALAQLGLLSEPQQMWGEETCYHRLKNQVLFLLRKFVRAANKVWWLSGQRVRLSI